MPRVKRVKMKQVKKWSDVKVGDQIQFVTDKRSFTYTVLETDWQSRSWTVGYHPPKYKRPRKTTLNTVPAFIKKGYIWKAV